MEQLLSGYKVLDFTHAIAGPTTTLLMAEMGADVIKVEHPPLGDMIRLSPFVRNGRSGCFVQHNRGKKSLCVALNKPEGLEIIKKLLPQFDVLIENFSPGVMKRLGLDYEAVSAINPRIIMCSISTFGQTGPLANKPGFDGIGAAYTGHVSRLGDPGQPPGYPQSAAGDVASGRVRAGRDRMCPAASGAHRQGPVHRTLPNRHLSHLPRNRPGSGKRQRRHDPIRPRGR